MGRVPLGARSSFFVIRGKQGTQDLVGTVEIPRARRRRD